MANQGAYELNGQLYRGVEPAAEDLTDYVGHFARVVGGEIGLMSDTNQATTNALATCVGVITTPTLADRSDYRIVQWDEVYCKAGTGGVAENSEIFSEYNSNAAKRGRAINIAYASLANNAIRQGIATEAAAEGEFFIARREVATIRK